MSLCVFPRISNVCKSTKSLRDKRDHLACSLHEKLLKIPPSKKVGPISEGLKMLINRF